MHGLVECQATTCSLPFSIMWVPEDHVPLQGQAGQSWSFFVLNKDIHILRNIRNYSPTTKHTSPVDLKVFLYVNEPNLLTRSCLQSE
jgi:hypothetical protein